METATNTAPAATAPDTTLKLELPGPTGDFSFDVAEIPPAIRMDFLKAHTRNYIANRVNQVSVRHGKNAAVIAWNAYDEAQKADPMQATVAKPTDERPAAPDLAAALAAALDSLRKGEVRKQGTGETKSRSKVDPLVKTVTDIVVREVFNSKHAADPKYTFLQAKKDVGPDGIAYLNTMIESKVTALPEGEQPAMRTALEKMRDERYIKPAKVMLGIDVAKSTKDLPSLL